MKDSLGSHFESVVLASTGASRVVAAEMIQDLWSGYGKILRLSLEGDGFSTVVVKHVRVPSGGKHPRGWNSNVSHQRKLKSYQVEASWYQDWSRRCDARCRVPGFLGYDREGEEMLLILEDLDGAGYPSRMGRVGWKQIEICLQWLAGFHANFMGESPVGLWETGCYWHLETRPDELAALTDADLKAAAGTIDHRLKMAVYQTLVHGDAKLANFCFSAAGDQVAAVDFQYVGGGCGMKDVAYFIGSCLDDDGCEKHEAELLDCYFAALRSAMASSQPAMDAAAVEEEWRGLFPLAWTDFHRFLKGWSPGHWKINSYSERLAREVLKGM